MLCIKTQCPVLREIVGESAHPGAQHVALHVQLVASCRLASTRQGQEYPQEGLQVRRHRMHKCRCPIRLLQITFPTKLGSGLQTDLHLPGANLTVSDTEQGAFAMVKHILHVVTAWSRKILLPTIVGKAAVSDVTLKSQPTLRARHRHIIRDLNTYLGQRPSVAILHQGPAPQFERTFQERIPLLASQTQFQATPTHIGIRLLDNKATTILSPTDQIQTGTNTPMPRQRLTISRPRT